MGLFSGLRKKLKHGRLENDGNGAGLRHRAFEHKPLEDDIHIRLLRITFENGSTEPTFSFEHHSLASAPPYTALSYCWGTREPLRLIQTQPDGRFVSATPNLAAFLATVPKLLRSRNIPLERMWIDALCIDQDNLAERSSQVRQMGEIYQKAKEVLVWLGPAGDDSTLAAQMVTRLARQLERLDLGDLESMRRAVISPLLAAHDQRSWTAVRSLLCRDYFRRIWVQQEIVRSRALRVLCGTDAVSWDDVTTLCTIEGQTHILQRLEAMTLAQTGGQSSRDPDGTTQAQAGLSQADIQLQGQRWANAVKLISNAQLLREKWWAGQPPQLLRALHLIGSAGATDPRDRIYGLLGMVARPGDANYVPSGGWYDDIDYSVSVEQVYTSFAQRQLTEGRSAWILPYSRLSPRSTLDLPSWVPDWQVDEVYVSVHQQTHGGSDQPPSTIPVHAVAATTVPNAIAVRGQAISTIRRLCAPAPWCDEARFDALDTATQMRLYREYYRDIEAFAAVHASAPDGSVQRRRIACWRTLMLNHWRIGESIAPAWDGREVQLLLEDLQHDEAALMARGGYRAESYRALRALAWPTRFVFGVTEAGAMGMFPDDARAGDDVVMLYGHSNPFVLRPTAAGKGGEEAYRVVGDCYVHGFVDTHVLNEDLAKGYLLV